MQKGDHFEMRYKVTDEIYNGFVTAFNDRNPLHTDEAFAIAAGFPQKVMHGNILNGFLSHFIGEGLPEKNVIIHSQTIQFSLPVFLHDELLFNAELNEVFESVKTFMFKFNFTNTSGKKVAKGTVQIGRI